MFKKIPLFWSPCMPSNETEDGTQYFYQVEQLTFLWILLTLIVIGNATVLIALLLSKADIFAFLLLFQTYREINRCSNIFMNLCFYDNYFQFMTYFVYNNALQRTIVIVKRWQNKKGQTFVGINRFLNLFKTFNQLLAAKKGFKDGASQQTYKRLISTEIYHFLHNVIIF